ncbi:ExeA-like protein [Pseudomonas syringae pv. helianthi]|uniref:ExeA-like protein n=2 Tax=Pseudomonas syringae group genomosp. 7 TaxID=251699 RepID=A0A0N8RMV8_9PSED|nr:ExeA-like protein [Pseudomonas syringae pv. helianthi]KPY86222.1 ExeA-like protein [Pseudomonas syringae pv. tagetis]RMW08557.1 hypothetical protein ALO98_200153 [Pseudomonas syringae pv. tagetis]RMW14477.1 ExeA-like protein [Pseudomonas syringae pv. tagetis]
MRTDPCAGAPDSALRRVKRLISWKPPPDLEVADANGSVHAHAIVFFRGCLARCCLRCREQTVFHLVDYLTGEKPVSAELVESVLSRQLDDLEPTLTRHGYRIKDLVEQFDAKPTEIKALFSNALDPARTTELRDRMLAAGLPI